MIDLFSVHITSWHSTRCLELTLSVILVFMVMVMSMTPDMWFSHVYDMIMFEIFLRLTLGGKVQVAVQARYVARCSEIYNEE